MAPQYTVVIPTVGRPSLATTLKYLIGDYGPRPREIIVVDDRTSGAPLDLSEIPAPVTQLTSGGRGPAAARNVGWRHARTAWVVFLDDDVEPCSGWRLRLAADLDACARDVAGSQGRIVVPLPEGRRPTDAERGVAGLETARWITADMAYRWAALSEVDGFDERFRRAYREDADLGLRVREAGYQIVGGHRVSRHPVRTGGFFESVAAQRGNADDAVMLFKHGRGWRRRSGAGRGMLPAHGMTTLSGAFALVAAVLGRRRAAGFAGGLWALATAAFARRRIAPGPGTPSETLRMATTSVLIPPVAVWQRLRGELRVRRWRRSWPAAVLFDRDDTLIDDVPYLSDPAKVRPRPGARGVLERLRAERIPVGVVSNQSGIARRLITLRELAAVNAEVQAQLGPFDTWQVCPHGPGDGCRCRKPRPGLIEKAADELGVDSGECVVIGDTEADIDAARAAGARGILVPSARTRAVEVLRARRNEQLARDLDGAMKIVRTS